jgi:hypothetical protein
MTEPPLERDPTPIGLGRGSEVKRMLRVDPAVSSWSHELTVTPRFLDNRGRAIRRRDSPRD